MKKFEQIGINMQYDAVNKEDAIKKFSRSCDACIHKGMNIDCDYCHISAVHALVVAYFEDQEAMNR